MTKHEPQSPDPRANRASLQDRQAAHQPTRPDLVDHLLRRAAAAICPPSTSQNDEDIQ
jgi:hypothetical protein